SPLMYHDIRYVLVFLVSAFSFALEEQTYSFDLYAVVYFYLLVYVSFVLSYLGDFAAFSPVLYFVHCFVLYFFSFVFFLLFIFIYWFMFLLSFLTLVILLLFPLSIILSIVLLRILFLLFIF